MTHSTAATNYQCCSGRHLGGNKLPISYVAISNVTKKLQSSETSLTREMSSVVHSTYYLNVRQCVPEANNYTSEYNDANELLVLKKIYMTFVSA